MQRIARFLLWGGLALLLIGATACGVGCIGAIDSTLNNNPETESLVAGIAVGSWMTFSSASQCLSVGLFSRPSRGLATRIHKEA